MAFKTSLDLANVSALTQAQYNAEIKRDIKKAAKLGQTEFVLLSDFVFACGGEGTLLIVGDVSGELAQFYKRMRKERKQERDFAKGTCVFKEEADEEVSINFVFDEGKAKPKKVVKNGKRLFNLLKIRPNFELGALEQEETQEEEATDQTPSPQLSAAELAQIEQEALLKHGQRLQKQWKNFQTDYQGLVNTILPRFKKNEVAAGDFEFTRNVLVNAKQFLQDYEVAKPRLQEKFAEAKTELEKKLPSIQQLAAKLKNANMNQAQAKASTQNLEEGLEEVGQVVKRMNQRFERAFELLNQLV